MGLFNFLKETYYDLKTYSSNISLDVTYKTLIIEVSIDLIAKTVSRIEFQTYEKGKEVKKFNYYLFNVEANQNKSASLFWREVVNKLLRNGEALILIQDNQMYLADSFTREELVFKENIYSDITIGDYDLSDTWTERKVLYLKDDRTQIKAAIEGINRDYKKLISSSIKGYLNSKSRKGKLEIPTNLPKGIESEEQLQEYIRQTMKDFMDPEKDAVYPESDGFKYTEIQEAKGSKSNDSGRETKNFINDMFDFIAIAFGIPPSLLKGDTVDTKDALNNFLTFCINPLAKLIQDEINRKMYGKEHFIENNYVKADTTNIKAVDLRDIANSIDLLTRNGAMTIDDILRTLGKEPIGGDIGQMRFITKNYELLDKVLKEGQVTD